MDSFNEQLVVRKNTGKHFARVAVLVLLIFSVPAVLFLLGINNIGTRYFVVVSMCALFFAVYGSYYLVTGLYIEYEYAVTNSNLTIDKIIGKRSRKRIISVDIKKFNSLKKLGESDALTKSYKKIFPASITDRGGDVYAGEMHLEKFNGNCLLLFSPDEKTLEAMKPFLKMNVKTELIKSGVFKPATAAKSAKTAVLEKKAPEKTEKTETKTEKPAETEKSDTKESAKEQVGSNEKKTGSGKKKKK